jgi:putative SOS response-associated peptidase YedK
MSAALQRVRLLSTHAPVPAAPCHETCDTQKRSSRKRDTSPIPTIPADDFFEWKKIGPKEKQPYNFGLATGSLFAFAGLWDRWRDPKNNILETCTILTTRPNSLVTDVHDRMPAILRVEDYECWLDPGITDPKAVLDSLKPFDASLMKKYPVSPHVNRPENNDEECIREVPIKETTATLF